jgi:hypothetical protein
MRSNVFLLAAKAFLSSIIFCVGACAAGGQGMYTIAFNMLQDEQNAQYLIANTWPVMLFWRSAANPM